MEHALEGRRLSRKVLGELAAVWAEVWKEAMAIQARNPDTMRIASGKTTDPEAAIVEILPHLSLLHPQIVASVSAFCQGVAAEFAADAADGVTGVMHTGRVDSEQTFGGGGQQQNRAVDDIEDENRRLRAEVSQLRGVLRALRAVIDGLDASES